MISRGIMRVIRGKGKGKGIGGGIGAGRLT